MQASVVVATYNRRDAVLKTVAALLNQQFPANEFEMVVVVDGSTDGTVETLRATADAARMKIVEQENRGPSAARNAGARAARGELLIFVDDDMRCEPDLVRAHVEAHSGRRHLAGMGAIYTEPEDNGLAARYFCAGFGRVYLRLRDRPQDAWPNDVWSFGNTSVRRTVFLEVGGFDEEFRMREDAELGVRLLECGVRPQFVVGAIAHQSCTKSARELVRDAEAFAEGDVKFMRKHPWVPHEFLRKMAGEPGWKARMRSVAANHVAFADAVLSPLCRLGAIFPALGLRALQAQCGLHWYRRMMQLSGREGAER